MMIGKVRIFAMAAVAALFGTAFAQDAEPAEQGEPAAAVEPAAATPAEPALPAGDAENGKKVFRLCMACHAVVENQHRVGPSLYGIVGRTAGTTTYPRYSAANRDSGVTWTEANLFEYLEDPRAYIKGTTMAFAGLRKEQDRADVIAYLKSVVE